MEECGFKVTQSVGNGQAVEVAVVIRSSSRLKGRGRCSRLFCPLCQTISTVKICSGTIQIRPRIDGAWNGGRGKQAGRNRQIAGAGAWRERAARLKVELLLDEKTQELNDERETLAQERFLLQALMDNIPDHVSLGQAQRHHPHQSRAGDAVRPGAIRSRPWQDRLRLLLAGARAAGAGRRTRNHPHRQDAQHRGARNLVPPARYLGVDDQRCRCAMRRTIIGTFGVSRDITEKKRAEEQLRLAANVFTHAREGILITGSGRDNHRCERRFLRDHRLPAQRSDRHQPAFSQLGSA